jgi:pentatricopeptide repeat-containing protein PET309
MLERTAGCLESGSLRRLLPASKKSLKSRRTLHSTFWHHGAGDLEISPLWAALVRAAEPVGQQSEVQQKTSTSHNATLLDFLYPAVTINFLRQYSGWGIDRQDGRWGRNGLGKLGYRQYTSSAKDTSITDEMTEVEAAEEQRMDKQHGDMRSLYRKMGLSKSYDYEEAWRQYMLLDSFDQQLLRKPLIQYLSKSDRVVDAERTTELFEMINNEQRDPSIYHHTIRAYLKLRNLSDAMKLHKAVFKNHDTLTGTAELLAYFMQNSSWSRAFSLWAEYQERKSQSELCNYEIFEIVDSLPNLGDQAIELAEYVSRKIRDTSPDSTDDNSGLTKFASMVILRALKSSEAFNSSRFSALLGFLHLWQMEDPVVYDNAIQTLLFRHEPKLAVTCYRQTRLGQGVKLSSRTLHRLLKILCDDHSILGMKQVLDDFFKFYKRPTRYAYRLCMAEFASQGDAKTVHALFEQYVSRFSGHLLSADELAPLLQVHAKRGELSRAINIFNQIETVYKLRPTIMCWNIIINAYGKVNDIDGAYECFERLLQSPNIRPDDYTFGTMMGICTRHGDLERVIEIYQLVEELKIKKSPAMLDSLVSAYIQEEDFRQAERVCEDGLTMKLRGSRTRMWNSLLIAYAMRRDLSNVNRLLQRMSEAKVNYNEHTYSTLMQALCMVKQPDRAYEILKEVMVEAGVKPTSFHYAVVMGGYLANGEVHKVFRIRNQMKRRNIRTSSSTSLMAFKATINEDEKLLNEGSDQEVLQRARQMFKEIISSIDPQDVSQAPRKGVGRLPLDIAHTTPFYSYIMFVLGQYHEFQAVNKLYDEFKRSVPEFRQETPPIEVLSALISTRLQERDHEGVQECWDLILSEAMQQGRTRPLPVRIAGRAQSAANQGNGTSDDLKPQSADVDHISVDIAPSDQAQKVLPAHKLDLAKSLVVYLQSLAFQNKINEMTKTVKVVLDRGFVLDNHTWNKYIQFLARKYQYRLAFKICEERLMPGWTGWAGIRWQLPVRNRLPLSLRRARQWPTHLRPLYYTMLYLARGFLELQADAAESVSSQNFLSDLERDCPMIVKAIRTMPRSDDVDERRILRGL